MDDRHTPLKHYRTSHITGMDPIEEIAHELSYHLANEELVDDKSQRQAQEAIERMLRERFPWIAL